MIKTILTLCSFIVLSSVIRWNTINMPLERDEGEYAYAAQILDQGNTFYKDFFIQKPPGIIYIYYVAQHLFGPSEPVYRILAILAIAITAFFITLAFVPKSWLVGWCSGILYIVIISLPVPLLWNGVANTEIFLNLPLSLALLSLTKHNFNWPRLLLLLISLFSAFLIKPTVSLMALGILIIYIYRHFWHIKGRDLRYSFGLFTLFVIIITLPITLQSSWKYLLESSIYYNIEYAQNYGNQQFITNLRYFWRIFFPILILILISLLDLKKHKALRFFWILLILGLVSLIPSPIPRYYLILFPILALLAGYAFQYIDKRFNYISLALLAVGLSIIIWPWKNNYTLNADDYMKCIYPRENFSESRALSSILNATMNSEASLYIVGSEPQIYVYTGKLSPTRFITKYPLMLKTPKCELYQREEIAILKQHQPDWIVYSLNPQSFLKDIDTPSVYEDYIHQNLLPNYIQIQYESKQFKLFRKK